MPSLSESKYIVLTADQIGSRKGEDAVPQGLAVLRGVAGDDGVRPFVRTAGDEIQGLLRGPTGAVKCIKALVRLGGWRLGIGIGRVQVPVPEEVRAATGPAFIAARDAIAKARSAPQDLAVMGESRHVDVSEAQAALDLMALLWRRRTDAGWEVAALVADGLSQQEIAKKLGVTPSAISQRVRAAAVEEGREGELLARACLERARQAVTPRV